MGTPALGSRLLGFCVVVPASDPTRPNWLPPPRFQARRTSLSALFSSSPAEGSCEPRFRPAAAAGDSSVDPLLPSTELEHSEGAKPKQNAAQSAVERAMAYKKMRGLAAPASNPTSSPPLAPIKPGKVEILAGQPIESRKPSSTDAGTSPDPSVGGEPSYVLGESRPAEPDGSNTVLSAFERAKAYRLQQAEMVAVKAKPSEGEAKAATAAVDSVVVEIHTRDGIVRRKVKPDTAFANVKDIKRKGVSTLDFVGLGFADKKSSSRPSGLSESFEAPSGPLPEVEILTRDARDIDKRDAVVEDGVYRPRVTTWGLFPRPADISKAYGGGRNIKPGQQLETEEEKIAREAKTKTLLDDYKKKLGLDMAPKDRARCETTMKNGESLMDRGQLKEAQAAFIAVMDEMPFPSELHGMAALQEAVCLDSLNRSDEAKVRYEKLVSHPNGAVRKKARQLLFGFQAAEKLKVRAGHNWDSSMYRKYFDAFADGYNTTYKKTEESADDEGSLMQTLAYALLIVPVILVLTLVALKNA